MQDEGIPDDLAGRLRRISEALGLKQRELADVMGVNLDRAKSLLTGKAKKIEPAELRALEERKHVRPQYLIYGEAPMFKSEAEVAMQTRLGELQRATQSVATLEAPDWVKRLAQEWLFAIERGDSIRIQELANVAVPQPREGAPPYADAGKVDDQLLEKVCTAVYRELQAQAIMVDPAKQAELITVLYEASAPTKAVNPATVKRLVRLAA